MPSCERKLWLAAVFKPGHGPPCFIVKIRPKPGLRGKLTNVIGSRGNKLVGGIAWCGDLITSYSFSWEAIDSPVVRVLRGNRCRTRMVWVEWARCRTPILESSGLLSSGVAEETRIHPRHVCNKGVGSHSLCHEGYGQQRGTHVYQVSHADTRKYCTKELRCRPEQYRAGLDGTFMGERFRAFIQYLWPGTLVLVATT